MYCVPAYIPMYVRMYYLHRLTHLMKGVPASATSVLNTHHTHAHAHAHAHTTHTHTHTHTHTRTHNTHTHAYTYIHSRTLQILVFLGSLLVASVTSSLIWEFVYGQVSTHARCGVLCAHQFLTICSVLYAHVCVRACMHACVYSNLVLKC